MYKKIFAISLLSTTLISCSQMPNSSYYNDLSYTDKESSRRYANSYPNTNKQEELYREKQFLRRELAEKNATIASLRKELLETRSYANDLMIQLSKIYENQERRNTASSVSPFIPISAEYPGIIRQPIAKEVLEAEVVEEIQDIEEQTTQPSDKNSPKQISTTPVAMPPQKTPTAPKEPSKNAQNAPTPATKPIPKPIQKKQKPKQASTKKAPQIQKPSVENKATALYKEAMQQLDKRQYAESRKSFNAFIQTYKSNTLLPNAYYWKGETYYGAGEYANAIATFIDVANLFPKSNKAPDALLKIVMSYIALKDTENAKKYTTILVLNYPKSSSAKRVQKMLF